VTQYVLQAGINAGVGAVRSKLSGLESR